ncbi:hypothetical protein TNCV_2185841 [Trichonephila clavipes]|nr:hypothetical protein TNCV_2185841 [Trichonephila clavipes]
MFEYKLEIQERKNFCQNKLLSEKAMRLGNSEASHFASQSAFYLSSGKPQLNLLKTNFVDERLHGSKIRCMWPSKRLGYSGNFNSSYAEAFSQIFQGTS